MDDSCPPEDNLVAIWIVYANMARGLYTGLACSTLILDDIFLLLCKKLLVEFCAQLILEETV